MRSSQFSLYQIKENEMSRACSRQETEQECVQKARRPEEKKPVGRPRHRWEDNV
jgi:hypothetical protein